MYTKILYYLRCVSWHTCYKLGPPLLRREIFCDSPDADSSNDGFARLVNCPDEPEESEIHPNQDMMFAVGKEPVGVRVLTYQSSSALTQIFNALVEEEVDIIRWSSFGKFIEIADKPVFSGRCARYMLLWQLKIKKKHDTWFRFSGKPVRFSLREFVIVMGQPCGKFPKNSKMKLQETLTEKPYQPSLFGKVEVVFYYQDAISQNR